MAIFNSYFDITRGYHLHHPHLPSQIGILSFYRAQATRIACKSNLVADRGWWLKGLAIAYPTALRFVFNIRIIYILYIYGYNQPETS